ncbi:fungal-specific transcription factor domain-containing protein [Dactylonectria estremocensis]|uniref:Fungal-specific transcription factor domain-containing protein n=1 Tax=Dactylonectria estremocensis TaxID=1079267 RepID=A0A9P9IUL9_9HYPO|nr:fungal-specific transcription factor domain-containing protein [Dactylonectria estremocensis]
MQSLGGLLFEMDEDQLPARQRNRATTACTACRKGRIRCNFNIDSKTCSHCQQNEVECVFNDKDGRKSRATARHVAEVLSRRIEYLESLLSNPAQSDIERAAAANFSALDMLPAPSESPPAYDDCLDENEALEAIESCVGGAFHLFEAEPPSSVAEKLVPSPILVDLSSGRVRCFGPTANMVILSKTCFSNRPTRSKSHWPIFTLVPELSPETNRYLLDLFWTHHNSIIHLVHLDAFYEDQGKGKSDYYSNFLHLCMITTGLRYADKSRSDVQELGASRFTTSTLHQKAKAMAKLELDQSKGIPTIQGLLLLGSLDFMSGDDEAGWLHTGLAFRIVIDVGLHIDPELLQITGREAHIRHMVLWASLITDKFWSLYLGRPITLKTADIAPSCLSFDFDRLLSCRSVAHEKKVGTRIYEALLRLMEVAIPLCDNRFLPSSNPTEAYLKVAAMEQALKRWHSGLESNLRWPSQKQVVMPASYFLLHTHYHAALILLHRPLIRYGDSPLDEEDDTILETDESFNHLTTLSRSICIKSAKCISRIFESYRTRFSIAQVFETGLQHAGTAATALMGEIAMLEREGHGTAVEAQELLVSRLESLRLTISLMSRNYQPAILMTRVVDQFIRQLEPRKKGPEKRSRQVEEPENMAQRVINPNKRPRLENSPDRPGDAESRGSRAVPSLPSNFLGGIGVEDEDTEQLNEQPEYWALYNSHLGLNM